jgi:serine/threonine-protein kinase
MRPEIAVWIARQVAAGLHAAHEMIGHDGQRLGVIHRDVSPQNVLLSVDGEVKLVDFGIAKAKGRAERTETGVIKGKVRYMAPEQAEGRGLDRRVDVYALGVVLWEMLTMRRYIEGKSDLEIMRKVRRPDAVPPSFRADGIDPRIDEAVLAALAVERERRPASAAAFERSLAQAVPDGRVGAAHVAELLRVFVGAKVERAARALPDAVGRSWAARIREPTPLPGDAPGARPDETARTDTLTAPTARVELVDEDDASTWSAPAVLPPTKELGLPERDRTKPSRPAARRSRSEAAALGFGEVDEEDQTVQASGAELADFFARMRADAAITDEVMADVRWSEDEPVTRPGRRAAAAAAPPQSPAAARGGGAAPAPGGAPGSPSDAARGQPPAGEGPTGSAPDAAHRGPPPERRASDAAARDPAAAAAPGTESTPGARAPAESGSADPAVAPPPAAGRRGSPLLRWGLVVLVVTTVAFALGAGAAVAWVRFVAS